MGIWAMGWFRGYPSFKAFVNWPNWVVHASIEADYASIETDYASIANLCVSYASSVYCSSRNWIITKIVIWARELVFRVYCLIWYKSSSIVWPWFLTRLALPVRVPWPASSNDWPARSGYWRIIIGGGSVISRYSSDPQITRIHGRQTAKYPNYQKRYT
jgi:hypothetical protein